MSPFPRGGWRCYVPAAAMHGKLRRVTIRICIAGESNDDRGATDRRIRKCVFAGEQSGV